MKLIIMNVIALIGAITLFGSSIAYAATTIKEVEQPVTAVYDYTDEYLGDMTAADILFPPSSEVSSVPSSEPSSKVSSVPSSEPSSKVSSIPSSEPSSKVSSVPSSEPSSEVSSVPSSQPSSEVSSKLDEVIIDFEDTVSSTPSSQPTPEVPPPSTNVDEHLVNLVAGAVQREIVGVNTAPNPNLYEAYKAQAVASHTYMEFYRKADGVYPTMSYCEPHPDVVDLTRQVINQLIYYDGKVINASYHASSGGATQSANYVWSNDIPYLRGVSSPYDDNINTYTISSNALSNSLANNGISTSGDPSTWFDLAGASLSDGGFIDYINICGQSVRGRTLREKVIGGKNLKSCKIIDISFDGANFAITTNGFGHGVGMSQIGALGFAQNEGWNYIQILQHYYQGTTIS